MKHILFMTLLSYLLNEVVSLQCYQCSTLEAKTCRDPYTTDDLGDCDDGQLCVKYKTVVKMRDSGYINGWERLSQVVTRTCEDGEGKKEGCIGWQNNGGVTIKCWCGSDGCNTAVSSSKAGLISILCSVIVSMLLAR